MYDVCSVEMGQVASLPKRFELRRDVWPEVDAGGLEVDEKDESLCRIGVEDAVRWLLVARMEVSDWVLLS